MPRKQSSFAFACLAGCALLFGCGRPTSSTPVTPEPSTAPEDAEPVAMGSSPSSSTALESGTENLCGPDGCPGTCRGSPTCKMPDGCPGTRECEGGVWGACEWTGTGSIACGHNGITGTRACGVDGPSTTCIAGCSACGLGGTQTWTEGTSSSWSACDISANSCNTTACASKPAGGYSCEAGALVCRFNKSWTFTSPEVACTTPHGVAGTAVCSNNGDGLCRGTEVCNGFDDNLDGFVDNEPGTWTNQPCVTSSQCGGTWVCRSGGLVCQAVGGTTNAPACTSTLGFAGHQNCSTDGRLLGCQPDNPSQRYETCNGQDDDADGVVDNIPGTSVPYTLTGTAQRGPCSGKQGCAPSGWLPMVWSGSQTCKNRCGDSVQQQCDPATGDLLACPERVEICNGEDDNCDGLIDEGDACRQQKACKQ